ncbi:MAG TPA: putative toxin-antitoxin system toxin component, PIN family [Silvibacterium sp.]|jgi:putative PIN family toxin of toxin-antitoxin system|nr:putative toxin-antitoxin system toxin component, PIN family [Silvibacterium sp.]
MIVVVDSNVSISALQFASKRGTPTRALEKAVNEDVIATCDEIDVELIRVLTERFRWSRQLAEDTLRRMLERSIRVTIRGTIHLCRDPSDDKFLECAERGNADLIITGDKDLLALKSHKRTRIITPAEYLQM